MTNIVVLDGFTLNPGDLSWQELTAMGHCQIYDRTPADLIVPRAKGAQMVLTNKTVLEREELDQLPDLRYVGVLATGYDVVDIHAARQRGIPVANVPTYGTRSVAQMTFALLLRSQNCLITPHIAWATQAARQRLFDTAVANVRAFLQGRRENVVNP